MNECEKKLKELLNYNFQDKSLLHEALVHSSYINEKKSEKKSNERLEYLGDAVMELIISDILYRKFPNEPEGILTRMRSHCVCEESFGTIGKLFSIDKSLLFGKGEELNGGRNKLSIIADGLEAVCGAIYLDGGYDYLYDYFLKHIDELLINCNKTEEMPNEFIDNKSKLQEILHKTGTEFSYTLVGEHGESHLRVYEYEVSIGKNHQFIFKGKGRSKKAAQQDAAGNALRSFDVIKSRLK